MTIPVIVLIIALVLIIVFFKDFNAFVYAFVMIFKNCNLFEDVHN